MKTHKLANSSSWAPTRRGEVTAATAPAALMERSGDAGMRWTSRDNGFNSFHTGDTQKYKIIIIIVMVVIIISRNDHRQEGRMSK